MTPAQLQLAFGFISEKVGGKEEITLFMAKAAPFSESLFENLVEPVVWWQAGNRLGFPSRLADFAVRVLSIVPSTAGLERLFSTLRLTYGLLRTNLGVEKAGKVGFLFRALRKS